MTVDADVKAVAPQSESRDTTSTAEREPGRISRKMRRVRIRWRLILLALLVIASVGGTSAIYYFQYRPDQQTNDVAAREAIRAASEGTVVLLSYSPDSLDRDLANAKTHLTGDFLAYYDDFTTKIVTPAAQQKGIKTTANVVRAAVAELQSDSAVVLVFVNQSTASKDKPEPVLAASSVRVTLVKVHGAWLISSFDPI
ncbi:Mce-associated membrane protein [Mycobacterium sp. OAE908]|uniref:twin-arginine translocation pathway signal n=1 Tax=Mycobacterium sp. OAE908 TaxID=2817899 RepID=UPI0034E27CEE